MAIGYKEQTVASVPTPNTGEQYTFIDTADGQLKRMDSSRVVTVVEAPLSGGVTSFEGRSGAVFGVAGDYTASEITNVPHGTITHLQVQAAINHLEDNKAPITHVGSTGTSEHGLATSSVAGFMSPSDKSKLDTVASGATANDTDANLKNRANHTGTQTASTISDFNTAADARVTAQLSDHVSAADPHPVYALDADVTSAQAYSIQRANHTGTQASSTISDFNSATDARISLQKGAASGLATLDGSSKVPQSQLPAIAITETFVVVSQSAMLALSAQIGDVAVRTDLNKTFILASSDPTLIGSWQELLTPTDSVTSVAGKTGVVTLDKNDVGLNNVDNTSDLNKPVSTAQAAAIALKADINNPTFTGTVSGVTKSMVGLGNVDNTSDLNKPVSTAQGAADAAVQAFAIQRTNHTGTQSTSTIANFTTDVQSAAVQNSLTPSSSVKAPSVDAVNTADALKANKAGDTFTGPVIAKGDNAGTGYVNYETQTSAPSSPSSGFRQFADASGRFSWKGTNGFVRTFNATGITADRVYSLPDQTTTLMGNPMTSAGDTIYGLSGGAAARRAIGSELQLYRVIGGVPTWDDENLGQDFGDGNLGSVTISAPVTLSNPVYYDTLTLVSGAVITTNGYPIYCKTLDLSNAPAGAIRWLGNNGTSATIQTGGAAGAALTTAALGGSGAGTAGATATVGAGTAGAAPTAASPGNGGNGGTGAAGGAGTNAGGASGAGASAANRMIFGRLEQQFIRGTAAILGGAGGRGGGSGGGDGVTVGNARGGGGGGSGGGMIAIYADTVITSASTPSAVIQANGGNGGNGASATATGNGGGGGGGAGGGGYVFFAFNNKTGPTISSLITANGGTGGNGGNSTLATGGNGGNGGDGGYIDVINFGTLIGIHVTPTAGSAGGAASGGTGGTGGSGGLASATF